MRLGRRFTSLLRIGRSHIWGRSFVVNSRLRERKNTRTAKVVLQPKTVQTRSRKRVRRPVELVSWLSNVAKTATLKETLICLIKLCLIVWSLSGIAFVSQLKDVDAPLQKIVDLLELALDPKAYPTSPKSSPGSVPRSSHPLN